MKDLTDSDASKSAKTNFSKFPFEIIETTGTDALSRWEKLKAAGHGIPVILGSDESVRGLSDPWDLPEHLEDPAKIMQEAESKYQTFSLAEMRKEESVAAFESLKKQGYDLPDEEDEFVAETGDWPATADRLTGPTVVTDILSGKPLPRVYIALIPAKAAYEIPAYLRWGGWNSNPWPMAHVIMLRRWQEKYGAELVGMTSDVINLRVKSRPSTREEALELANEMYLYCADIIDQGFGELAPLAASLMESEYWYFWWD